MYNALITAIACRYISHLTTNAKTTDVTCNENELTSINIDKDKDPLSTYTAKLFNTKEEVLSTFGLIGVPYYKTKRIGTKYKGIICTKYTDMLGEHIAAGDKLYNRFGIYLGEVTKAEKLVIHYTNIFGKSDLRFSIEKENIGSTVIDTSDLNELLVVNLTIPKLIRALQVGSRASFSIFADSVGEFLFLVDFSDSDAKGLKFLGILALIVIVCFFLSYIRGRAYWG